MRTAFRHAEQHATDTQLPQEARRLIAFAYTAPRAQLLREPGLLEICNVTSFMTTEQMNRRCTCRYNTRRRKTMSTYTIDDQPVHVKEEGPANGPIAILIHGWSSSSFTWAPILPTLNRRYRCIAVDL